MQDLKVSIIGRSNYAAILPLMNQIHDLVAKGEHEPVILVTEHEAVVTMGNRKLREDLRFPILANGSNGLPGSRLPYFEIDRGGSATAHEPGQLVVYPILPIQWFSGSVRAYVGVLERAVIQTCRVFGVAAECKREFPGVWVGERKIAAVGVRVKNHVTKHGLAFNVINDLSAFDQIVPCGIRGKGVTSLCAELNSAEHDSLAAQASGFGNVSRQELFAAAQSTLLENLQTIFLAGAHGSVRNFVIHHGSPLVSGMLGSI